MMGRQTNTKIFDTTQPDKFIDERIKFYTPDPAENSVIFHLTSSSLHLGSSTLCTLFGHLLTLTMSGRALGLLSLLLGLNSSLLLFALLDCLRMSRLAGLGTQVTPLLNHVERGTDNGTLGLDSTARTLLGDFLRYTLLVLAAVENGPGYPPRILALEEKRLRLAVHETEDFGVATDEDLTLGRVDFATGKGILLDLHCCC